MTDNRKVINPLLNASVTGGTFEEFTQNAVLLPAAEIPQAPTPEPLIPEIDSTFVSDSNFNTQEIGSAIQFNSFTQVPPFIDNSLQNQPQQPIFQSVFSSVSSYLNLGQKSEPEITHVPSVVDSVLNQGINFNVEPVPLYTPTEQQTGTGPFLQQTSPSIAATPPVVTNTYRRAGLKRPTYAPIPGLSNASKPFQPSTADHPPNLPPIPPKSSSPFNNYSANPVSSLNYFQPELSGYNTSQVPTVIPAPIPTPTQYVPTLNATSPILNPLSASEIPLSTFNNQNHSTFFDQTISTPIMATTTTNEAPNLLGQNTVSFAVQDNQMGSSEMQSSVYRPVYHHWFHKRELEDKVLWNPFSMVDSLACESAYLSIDLSPEKIIPTDGGRYDVNILRRERNAVYWNSPPAEVRRCSWFHKGSTDGKYVPYEENVAAKLEEEFKIAYESNTWNRKVELPNEEVVMFHGPDVLVLFPQMQAPDAWGNTPNQPRPRVVKRGMDEFNIDEGEPAKVDHLLFLVHGIGSVCDLKFRSVEEVVDEFRSISLQLVQAHYKSSCEKGMANRVEVLPISWHEKLHSEDTGVDKKLKGITLESIPKLRDFTNDTILDVLFYTSPVYCQTIISSVGNELNRIYDLFKQRNPSFSGGVSLGGHSLGSLILFDILCHQHPETEQTERESEGDESEDVISPLKPQPDQRKMSRRISYMMGAMGTGQPQLNYPHLNFSPKHFFALGSPIGMFVTVRGLDTLGEQFSLPTCTAFFNIFHPYDPVAYRVESLVNPELANLKPVLIPHHKGRKRMHLELKETMARVGADLKQKLIDSMKNTWNSFSQFAMFKQVNTPSLEEEVDKVVEEQLQKQQHEQEQSEEAAEQEQQTDLSLGTLNQGRRIDYVLQEAPLEFFNEYIFALTSHVCYWESQDTMLLILKEIYSSLNISTDSQIPQQTMTIERPPASPKFGRLDESKADMGVDPTLPMIPSTSLGPPPTSGFVKKS